MEAAQLLHQLVAGAEVKMVGVGQLDLAANLFQVMGRHAALNGRLRTHIHKNRGLDSAAVGTGKFSPPGAALGFDHFKHRVLLQKLSIPL